MPDDISLHASCTRQVTCISNSFIDFFMKDANGEYVKIYLYLLRCLGQEEPDFSISAMAETLDHTERDIKLALKYWEKCHLLRLEFDSQKKLVGICLLDADSAVSLFSQEHPALSAVKAPVSVGKEIAMLSSESSPVSDTDSSFLNAKKRQVSPSVPSYSAEQILSFEGNPEIKELLHVTEKFFGHPFSANDMNTILFWYDQLQLSADLIEYLVEYCIEKDHRSIRYMNKIAISWSESGISTVSDAKIASTIHSKADYAVISAFGISGRNLIASEQAYIEKWTTSFAFSLDIISEACRRTIANTGKTSFEYADSILKSWHNAGIRHFEEIAALDKAHSSKKSDTNDSVPGTVALNRFHNFPERSYDFDAIERKLLHQ